MPMSSLVVRSWHPVQYLPILFSAANCSSLLSLCLFRLNPPAGTTGGDWRGNYASRFLIPSFAKAGARFHTLVASALVRFMWAVSSAFGRPVPMLMLSLPIQVHTGCCHPPRRHASLVLQALAAGKHVFVEKPLLLTAEELIAIEAAYTGDHLLMVGFNRRFAPLLIALKQQLQTCNGPKSFVYTCGAIPLTTGSKIPLLVVVACL